MDLVFLAVLLAGVSATAAVFGLAESALFSLGSVRLRRMKIRRALGAALVRSLLARPRHLLVTIVIANTLALTAGSSLATIIGNRVHPLYGSLIAAAAYTVVVFIFLEALPKTAGLAWAERGASFTAPIVYGAAKILYPVNRLFLTLITYVGSRRDTQVLDAGSEDIYGLLDESEEDGVLDDAERAMIARVLALRDMTAGALATPRTKIFALPANTTYQEAARAVREAGFGRIPVYGDGLEDIVGVLYARDMLLAANNPPAVIRELARPAHFVPASLRVLDLFLDFTRYRTHIAFVVDEYGALDGIVTMTDVLNEVTGKEPINVRRLDACRFTIPGELELSAFNELVDANLVDAEAETIAGLIINRLGHIPARGEAYREGPWLFTVVRGEPHRILELAVERREEGGV